MEGCTCFHPNASKTDAEVLVAGGENGTHLVRRKGSSEDRFILTMRYMNMPTHHMLEMNDDTWTVNGQNMGDFKTVQALLDHLATAEPSKRWPIKIINPILPESGPAVSNNTENVDVKETTNASEVEVDTKDPLETSNGKTAEVGVDDKEDRAEESQTTQTTHTPGKIDVQKQFPPAVASPSTIDETSHKKPITAPKIDSPEVDVEVTNARTSSTKRLTRAEKQALMQEEERKREERIREAVARKGQVEQSKDFDPKKQMMDASFLDRRNKAKREQEMREQEEKLAAEKNATSWKKEALARKQKRASENAVPPKETPKTKAELFVIERKKKEEDAIKQSAALKKEKEKEEKERLAKEKKSKEEAEKMKAEREAEQEALLKGLPKWKRDKILRDQENARKQQEYIAAEKEKRLIEMREQREKEEREREEAREEAQQKALRIKKLAKKEEEAKARLTVQQAIEEVRKKQEKLALKSAK